MLGVFEAAVTPGFALLTSQVCFERLRYGKPLTSDSGIPNTNKESALTSGSALTA